MDKFVNKTIPMNDVDHTAPQGGNETSGASTPAVVPPGADASLPPKEATSINAASPQRQAVPEDFLNTDYDDEDWVPRAPSGEQKTCSRIRSDINRFLRSGEMTQTAFLQEISCNSNSYRNFMKYKDPHTGYGNCVYWGAARFLERRKRLVEATKKAEKANAAAARKAGRGTKRKSDAALDSNSNVGSSAKKTTSKKLQKEAMLKRLEAIRAVDIPVDSPVFDTCAEVRRKIEAFLRKEDGINQSMLCKHIGVQSLQLNRFLEMKPIKGESKQGLKYGQPGGASAVYPRAYMFFEQLRMLQKTPKSKSRIENEEICGPHGFALKHDTGHRWVFGGR